MNEFPPLDHLPEPPDVEALMVAYLARFGHACSEYPDPEDFESLLPIILINRNGGGAVGTIDIAPVFVAITGATRSDSWRVMGEVRRAVKAAEHGAVVDGVVCVEMGEIVGPQQVPLINPDQREVHLTFTTQWQLPRV